MTYFRDDNTDGYTQEQLDALNDILLAALSNDPDADEKSIAERILRDFDTGLAGEWKQPVVAAYQYQAIEDNGGGLHLAVFVGDECRHLFAGLESAPGALRDAITALERGDDPAGWDGQSGDPQGEYDSLTGSEHGWRIVADEGGIYPDRMGRAAWGELQGGNT